MEHLQIFVKRLAVQSLLQLQSVGDVAHILGHLSLLVLHVVLLVELPQRGFIEPDVGDSHIVLRYDGCIVLRCTSPTVLHYRSVWCGSSERRRSHEPP